MVMMTSVVPIYTVMVHEAEEGGYWAEVRELPGCVSQAETLADLEVNIKEAIEAVLQAQSHKVDTETQAEGFEFIGHNKRQTWTAVA